MRDKFCVSSRSLVFDMVVWRYSLDIQEEMLRGSEDMSSAAEGRLGQEI